MNSLRIPRLPLYFVLCLVAQAETLVLTPREDSAVRLFVAERMTAGDVYGRDIWDNKLPPIYLVGQVVNATGHPQAALWLMEAILTALAAWMVDKLVRQTGSPAAALAAASTMCLASGLPSLHAGGYMTEIYAMAFAATGMWLTLTSVSMGARPRAVAAGLCWGLAVAFRLPMILAAVPVVGLLTLRGARTASPESPRPAPSAMGLLAAELSGGLLAVLLVFAHPMVKGYLADCLHVAVDWPLNLSAVRIPGPLTATTTQRLMDYAQDLLMTAWIQVPALAGYALVLIRRKIESYEARRVMAGCLVWHLASLATGLAGWASYGHYLYVSLAPAAVGIGALLCAVAPGRQRAVAWAFPIVACAVTCGMSATNIVKRRAASVEPDMTCVARAIDARAASGETVFCWISGRDARLLSFIGRPTGNPHIIAPSYFRMDLRLLEEWALHMVARPPDWIVEDVAMRRPSIREPGRFPWESAMPGLRSVQQFVARNYREQARCGRFVVFRRVEEWRER